LLSPILAAGDRQRDRYVQLSNELLEMGKYSESDGYFEKAMAINSNGYEYLRRARAYAKAGEKDQAFQNLDKAAGYGYISKQEFVSDADLAALRQDSRWKKLIDTLK
jgi:tetratricopeptide (TPR) repeat protein